MTDLLTFRRWRWIPAAVLVAWLLQVAWWAFDREPPFRLVAVETAQARAGETLQLNASVWRDPTRNCDAVFTRQVFDADGRRYDMEGQQQVSAKVIAMQERSSAGALRIGLQLPSQMALGPAFLVSTLDYSCNPIHEVWPIRYTTIMPFEVIE